MHEHANASYTLTKVSGVVLRWQEAFERGYGATQGIASEAGAAPRTATPLLVSGS